MACQIEFTMSSHFSKRIMNLPWESILVDGITFEKLKCGGFTFKLKGVETNWEWPYDYHRLDEYYNMVLLYSRLYNFCKRYFDCPRRDLYTALDDLDDQRFIPEYRDLLDIMFAADRRIGIDRLSGLFFLTNSDLARRIISYRIGKKKCTLST